MYALHITLNPGQEHEGRVKLSYSFRQELLELLPSHIKPQKRRGIGGGRREKYSKKNEKKKSAACQRQNYCIATYVQKFGVGKIL